MIQARPARVEEPRPLLRLLGDALAGDALSIECLGHGADCATPDRCGSGRQIGTLLVTGAPARRSAPPARPSGPSFSTNAACRVSMSSAAARSKGAAWHKIETAVWKYHSAIRRRLENEPHLLELVALVQEKKLAFVDNFNSFIVACVTRIIEQGIETKEFRPLDSVVAAQAIMDCVAFATHPIFIGDFPAKEHERRMTAQLSLLAHAVRLHPDVA